MSPRRWKSTDGVQLECDITKSPNRTFVGDLPSESRRPYESFRSQNYQGLWGVTQTSMSDQSNNSNNKRWTDWDKESAVAAAGGAWDAGLRFFLPDDDLRAMGNSWNAKQQPMFSLLVVVVVVVFIILWYRWWINLRLLHRSTTRTRGHSVLYCSKDSLSRSLVRSSPKNRCRRVFFFFFLSLFYITHHHHHQGSFQQQSVEKETVRDVIFLLVPEFPVSSKQQRTSAHARGFKPTVRPMSEELLKSLRLLLKSKSPFFFKDKQRRECEKLRQTLKMLVAPVLNEKF